VSDKEPREVWISDPNKYESGVYSHNKLFEDSIKMIEKSAYDAKRAEVEKLKADLAVEVEALAIISKNKTDDCEIYTLGCDCDEEAIKALTKIKEQS